MSHLTDSVESMAFKWLSSCCQSPWRTFCIKKVFTPIVFTLIMLFANMAFAQTDALAAKTTTQFKVNFFLPGLTYEQKISRLSTLNLDMYLDGLVIWGNEFFNESFDILLTPSFKAEYRTYYNLDRRNEKGLRTANNSGNYFAPVYIGRYSLVNDYENHKWVNQLGAVWGMQRSYPSGFSFDFNLGLAYTFDSSTYYYYDGIQPVTHLRLGYLIGNKQKYQVKQ